MKDKLKEIHTLTQHKLSMIKSREPRLGIEQVEVTLSSSPDNIGIVIKL